MSLWREFRRRQVLTAGPDGDASLAHTAREVDFIVQAGDLRPGDRVLLLQACDGCHGRTLTAAGFSVETEEGETGPGALAANPGISPSPAGAPFQAILLFGATILPFWEVEEAHRARLRRFHALLAPEGLLSFGERFTRPRVETERDRLQGLRANGSDEELRRLLAPRARFTHYTPAQLRLLLGDCGFTLAAIHNHYAPAPLYDHDAPGMIVLARRI